ncbi:MAG TPA: hypothetical protein VIL55_15705 [Naasia sp.]
MASARRAQTAAERLRLLAGALRAAIDAYSAGSHGVDALLASLVAGAAWGAGFLAPALLVGLLPRAPLAALLALRLVGDDPERARAILRELLSDPRVVAALRPAVDGTDDALRGLLHIPSHLGPVLDDHGLGLLGREGSALLLALGLGAAGVTTSGPATVRRVGGPAPVSPPRSLGELAARVPETGGAAPQIRVERYPGAEGPRYAVYIGGTAELRGADPWDLASDLAATADVPADSVEATAEAMRRAGIRPGEPVVLVGYSQGGLIATRLAESGDFAVTGIFALGSPASTPVVPVLGLEHTDDPVPALAGAAPPPPATVRVEREAIAGPPAAGSGGAVVPAHALDAYRETAALADRSGEERLAAIRRALLAAFADGGAGEATRWHAERAELGQPVSGARPPAAGV